MTTEENNKLETYVVDKKQENVLANRIANVVDLAKSCLC